MRQKEEKGKKEGETDKHKNRSHKSCNERWGRGWTLVSRTQWQTLCYFHVWSRTQVLNASAFRTTGSCDEDYGSSPRGCNLKIRIRVMPGPEHSLHDHNIFGSDVLWTQAANQSHKSTKLTVADFLVLSNPSSHTFWPNHNSCFRMNAQLEHKMLMNCTVGHTWTAETNMLAQFSYVFYWNE